MNALYLGRVTNILDSTNTIEFTIPHRVDKGIAYANDPFRNVMIGDEVVLYLMESIGNSLWTYTIRKPNDNKLAITDPTKDNDNENSTGIYLDFDKNEVIIKGDIIKFVKSSNPDNVYGYAIRVKELFDKLNEIFNNTNKRLQSIEQWLTTNLPTGSNSGGTVIWTIPFKADSSPVNWTPDSEDENFVLNK